MEQDVWNRVFAGRQTSATASLGELLREAQTLAAIYQSLLPRLAGPVQALARELMETEQENAACLQGLAILTHASLPAPRPPQVPRLPRSQLLEHCWQRTQAAIAAYTAHSADYAAGEVYRTLTARESQQPARLCRLAAGSPRRE